MAVALIQAPPGNAPRNGPTAAPLLAEAQTPPPPPADEVVEALLLPRRWLSEQLEDSPRRVALWERIEWRFAHAASSDRQRTAGREPAIARGRASAPHACGGGDVARG